MPAPKARTAAERLRFAADELYLLAERSETPQRCVVAAQMLQDDIETVAGDIRSVVRGRGFR